VVFRRLLVIALLALISVAGVAATTAMANTPLPATTGAIAASAANPTSATRPDARMITAAAANRAGVQATAPATADPATQPATGATAARRSGTRATADPAMPAKLATTAPVSPGSWAMPFGRAGAAGGSDRGAPCVQQASCAGGALLAGATLLLFLPATGLALPVPAPVAPVVAVPARLRSALLASKLFRPPRAS